MDRGIYRRPLRVQPFQLYAQYPRPPVEAGCLTVRHSLVVPLIRANFNEDRSISPFVLITYVIGWLSVLFETLLSRG